MDKVGQREESVHNQRCRRAVCKDNSKSSHIIEGLDALGPQWGIRIQILGNLVSQAKKFRFYHLAVL